MQKQRFDPIQRAIRRAMSSNGTTLHVVMNEPFIFALRNRASGPILVAGYAMPCPGGDPRRDDDMRRAASP